MSNNIVLSYNNQKNRISFPVIEDDIAVNQELSIKSEAMLKNNKGKSTKHMYKVDDTGHSFEVTVAVLTKADIKTLDNLYADVVPLNIVLPPSIPFKAIKSSQKWIMVKKKYKQDNLKVVEATLEFSTYNPPAVPKLLDTSIDQLAIKFKKCKSKIKTFKYKKKKQNKSDCILTLKKILDKCGYDVKTCTKYKKVKKKGKTTKKCTKKGINNVYNKKTAKAVKKFKKDWNKYVYEDKKGVNKKNKKGKRPYKKIPQETTGWTYTWVGDKLVKKKTNKKYTTNVGKTSFDCLCNYKVLINAKKKRK